MKVLMLDWLMTVIEIVLIAAIAFGTIWTAYESHIANIGVLAWQHEFDQIHQPDGPSDNHTQATPMPSAVPTSDVNSLEYNYPVSPHYWDCTHGECADTGIPVQD